MRIALVSPGFGPRLGSPERHVESLARGLARRGVEVELITQDASLRSSRVDGIGVRRFPTGIGRLRQGFAPGLREYLRRTAGDWDVVHLHSGRDALGLAASAVAPRRLVFTPLAPIGRLLGWPYGHVVRGVLERAGHTVSLSESEAGLIRSFFPVVADRVLAVPPGVDVAALDAASPLTFPGDVVLTGGRLERCERLKRTIAAMATLDRPFRLVIIGGGPAARRLARYADDLRVSDRVCFTGVIATPVLHRWLSTARVLVTLSELEPSGLHALEALSAGASVVASDVPVHREVASSTAGAAVRLVDADCSPLQLADAIASAAETRVPPAAIPAAEALVEPLLALYRSIAGRGHLQSANGHAPTRHAAADAVGAAQAR
jgi:glycosyltransferase involved in cell wall biosynthesis